MRTALLATLALTACGSPTRASMGSSTDVDAAALGSNTAGVDAPVAAGPDAADPGCGGLPNCTSVYAHSDSTLYQIDLSTNTLQTIGGFQAPMVGTPPKPDPITDLAVAPDGTLWVISETALYTASATDGHVTAKGSLAACGARGVALTFTPGGELYEGDFKGAICKIDLSGPTPVVGAPTTLSDGMALSGDFVAVGDGTVFGTLYKLTDAAGKGTQKSNVLGTIDLATGKVTSLGASGYPKLFGASFAHGKVIGFTHDGTGHVIAMDPTTGAGQIVATFTDPTTTKGVSFAGAGVNALVSVIQ